MSAVTCTNAPATKFSFSPLAWIVHAWETRRERLALTQLDASRLNDIGLTKADVQREANRPIWDVPAHWSN